MKIAMIASGSKGNCCYIESNGTKILIDVGITRKRITSYFNENNIEENIDGILITHEHVDHIAGLVTTAKALGCPVYMTKGTLEGSINKFGEKMNELDIRIITNQSEFYINDIKITAIPTFHDAYDPNGYMIENEGKKIVYITDTGYIHNSLFTEISGADCYVMETNHDPDMLMSCEKRPYQLRLRILGDHGHMSNEDGLYNLCSVMSEKTKTVFFAHISEDCNNPELVVAMKDRMFNTMGISQDGINFVITSQIPTGVIEL